MSNNSIALKPVLYTLAIFVLGLSPAIAQEEKQSSPEFRQWIDETGEFKRTARFVSVDDGVVTLEKKDGIQLKVELKKLSKADQDYITQLQPEKMRDENHGNENHGNGNFPNDDEANRQLSPREMDNDADQPEMDKGQLEGEIEVDGGDPNLRRPFAKIVEPKCKTCRDEGMIPLKRLKMVTELRARGKWKDLSNQPIANCCPECRKDEEEEILNTLFELPEDESEAMHEEWEKKLDTNLVQIDTNYLTIRSQLSKPDSLKIAKALETYEQEMQKLFGSMKFSIRRRGLDEHLVFSNDSTFNKFIDHMIESDPGGHQDWDLLRNVTMSFSRDKTFVRLGSWNLSGEGPSVFVSAFAQMQKANNWAKAHWLPAGFGSYFESVVTRQNSCYMSGKIYSDGGNRLKERNITVDNSNWDRVVRGHARQGTLIPWSEMYYADYGSYEQLHDLQCKAMVAFLIEEPEKFLKFVELLAGGAEQLEALESAYEKSPDKLEKEWIAWLR